VSAWGRRDSEAPQLRVSLTLLVFVQGPYTSAGGAVRRASQTGVPRGRRSLARFRFDPPAHRSCFLHRDFHPGNVLFNRHDNTLRVSGVVDWVETSWGPADLDVAHCSTALALLHGVETGMAFAERYVASGGKLDDEPAAHLYWRLLDALAFAPDAEKVAVPWRELGRFDLTPRLLSRRLEDYIETLINHYN
jgi:hypothetical protein